MSSFGQFRLLMWKNYIIQRRQCLWSVFELIIPILLTVILTILRQQVVASDQPAIVYPPFSVSGSGDDLIELVDGRCLFGKLFHPYTLFYSPNTTVVNRLMELVQRRFILPNFIHQSRMIDCLKKHQLWHRIFDDILPDHFNRLELKTIFDRLHIPDRLQLRAFDSEKDMVSFLTNNSHNPSPNSPNIGGLVFGSEFSNNPRNSTTIRYKIRLFNSLRNVHRPRRAQRMFTSMFVSLGGWHTDQMYPWLIRFTGPRQHWSSSGGHPGYWHELFLTIQKAVDSSIVQMFVQNRSANCDAKSISNTVELRRFPYPAYVDNPFIPSFERQFPITLLLSMLVSILYVTRTVVHEKETRLKEYMRVMGLNGRVHWTAHFSTGLIKMEFIMLSITTIIVFPINDNPVLTRSDPSLIFVYLSLYGVGTVCYSLLMATVFVRADSAVALGGMFWFLTYTPYMFLQPHFGRVSLTTKLTSCLFLSTTVSWGAQVLGSFEARGSGLRWTNLFSPAVLGGDSFCMAHVFAMLVVDSLLMILITWYLEEIRPDGQGVQEKPWFPFLLSYWLTRKTIPISNDNFTQPISTCTAIEDDPLGMDAQICINRLTKVYSNAGLSRIWDKMLRFRKRKDNISAVSDLSLKMFRGQVTALLGHNGAGKSTTMSMLTGLITPTSGSAIICSYDIRDSLPRIRRHLGLCPQYNCLFDNLTVEEHLILFCQLKNRPVDYTEIGNLLCDLGLKQKAACLSQTLSGGMKRKLSMAIALVGGSEIVMLDEPTSGMDVGARHEAWTLLQREKSNRTVLLSTHYMEEADLLGDRIAIMARGKVLCCGSGLFLKNLYGRGYQLTVLFLKLPTDCPSSIQNRAQKVLSILVCFCDQSKLNGIVGLEATFTLAYADCAKFQNLFAELETKQSYLNVASFGVSITTMEEVFLRVGHIADDNHPADWIAKSNDHDDLFGVQFGRSSAMSESTTDDVLESVRLQPIGDLTVDENVTFWSENATLWSENALDRDDCQPLSESADSILSGFVLFRSQFSALLIKKARHSFRNRLVLFAQLCLPVLFIILAVLVNKVMHSSEDLPPLVLNLEPFGNTVVTLRNGRKTELFLSAFEDSLFDQSPEATFRLLPRDANFTADFLHNYAQLGASTMDRHYIVGLDTRTTNNVTTLVGYFNNQPFHSPAVVLNVLDNALFRFLTNQSDQRIETINHPLPPTSFDRLTQWMSTGFAEYTITVNLLFGFAFLSSSFIVFLVNERQSRVKHLQLLCGVHPLTFWLSTFVWDVANYCWPIFGVLCVLFLFDVTPIIGRNNWTVTLVLMFLHGWASLPLHYAASFFFSSASSGFVKMTVVNIFTGLVALTVSNILLLLGLQHASRTLDWVLLPWFPNYCLGQGVQYFYMNEFIKDMCHHVQSYCSSNLTIIERLSLPQAIRGCCIENCDLEWENLLEKNSLQWSHPGIGRMFVFMLCQGSAFWMLVLMLEMDLFPSVRRYSKQMWRKCTKSSQVMSFSRTFNDRDQVENDDQDEDEDEDVQDERVKVEGLAAWNDHSDDTRVLVRALSKYYGDFAALRGVNFSVRSGECFGLLGVNGAGKTSTFRMLTGEDIFDCGSVSICGLDVHRHWKTVFIRTC